MVDGGGGFYTLRIYISTLRGKNYTFHPTPENTIITRHYSCGNTGITQHSLLANKRITRHSPPDSREFTGHSEQLPTELAII